MQQLDETTYTIYNVYCPPRTTLQLNFPNTDHKNTILAGDFNGHSPLWGYSDTDTTGTVLEELLRSSNLISLQNDKTPPTLLHRASGTLSRPDLTLVSADLHPHCSMIVLDDIGSDHRPILLQISSNRKREPTNPTRRSWNYKKANWELYKQKSESRLLEVCTTRCGRNALPLAQWDPLLDCSSDHWSLVALCGFHPSELECAYTPYNCPLS